jgi:hypothetical protein
MIRTGFVFTLEFLVFVLQGRRSFEFLTQSSFYSQLFKQTQKACRASKIDNTADGVKT